MQAVNGLMNGPLLSDLLPDALLLGCHSNVTAAELMPVM